MINYSWLNIFTSPFLPVVWFMGVPDIKRLYECDTSLKRLFQHFRIPVEFNIHMSFIVGRHRGPFHIIKPQIRARKKTKIYNNFLKKNNVNSSIGLLCFSKSSECFDKFIWKRIVAVRRPYISDGSKTPRQSKIFCMTSPKSTRVFGWPNEFISVVWSNAVDNIHFPRVPFLRLGRSDKWIRAW